MSGESRFGEEPPVSAPLLEEARRNEEEPETAEEASSRSSFSLPLCRVGSHRRMVLVKPRLFLQKTVLVVAASYSLIPLLLYKSKLPGGLYASLLVVIHVGVLAVYLYGVRVGELDSGDCVSLSSRVTGLAVAVWLLTVVSGWQDRDHVGILAAQMLVLCLVHTFVLSLLMVAVELTDDDSVQPGVDVSEDSGIGED